MRKSFPAGTLWMQGLPKVVNCFNPAVDFLQASVHLSALSTTASRANTYCSTVQWSMQVWLPDGFPWKSGYTSSWTFDKPAAVLS